MRQGRGTGGEERHNTAAHASQPRRRPSSRRPRVTLSGRVIKHHTRTQHAVWASRSIACGSREYSGSVLLSDVSSPLREVRTPATDVGMVRWGPAADGGLARSTDSGARRQQMADGRDIEGPQPHTHNVNPINVRRPPAAPGTASPHPCRCPGSRRAPTPHLRTPHAGTARTHLRLGREKGSLERMRPPDFFFIFRSRP